ncbi:hypothetical protein DPMN_105801 [Dreissena polymorpha]|uniref:Uncharacterized protein n=1 Tax=Dreissena polymorpha TaxID=45954 RepID=A0A9D4K3W4_DREPO|nr:hypothetical protein DPMN_105801 [Dreissena polymorpha]
MGPEVNGEHNDVIEVYEAFSQVHLTHACLHKPLKRSGALQHPNGILLNSSKPGFLTWNAVFSLSCSSISTCQYPAFKSILLKYWEPAKRCKVSSILGSAYASLCVQQFSFRKSRPNRIDPSFFRTVTTFHENELFDGRMAPMSSISCTCFLLHGLGLEALYGMVP